MSGVTIGIIIIYTLLILTGIFTFFVHAVIHGKGLKGVGKKGTRGKN